MLMTKTHGQAMKKAKIASAPRNSRTDLPPKWIHYRSSQVIYRRSTYQPTYLPTYLPAYLPTYLPTTRFIVLLIEVGAVFFPARGRGDENDGI